MNLNFNQYLDRRYNFYYYRYPEARALNRKIIFHSGPTNSGKTFHALERFFGSKSGVYCGPLKLLASEVFYKSNQRGVSCDLVTGEERNFAKANNSASSHVSCTVEMVSVNTPYEVCSFKQPVYFLFLTLAFVICLCIGCYY